MGEEADSGRRRKRRREEKAEQEGGASCFAHANAESDSRFSHGNYTGYARRRVAAGGDGERDGRLSRMNPEWFRQCDVLDLGCNDGAVSIAVARDFGARWVVGVDLDASLIQRARASLRQLAQHSTASSSRCIRAPPPLSSSPSLKAAEAKPPRVPSGWIPLSLQLAGRQRRSTGADGLSATGSERRSVAEPTDGFPFNVRFVCEDIAAEECSCLKQNQTYDAVLLLSVTKWLQLHGGDDAVRRVFRRTFGVLRPGGKLVLEPQPFHTYRRKLKFLPMKVRRNYRMIRLRPDAFVRCLMEEVGFASVETIRDASPSGEKRAFNRPMYVLTKGAAAPQELHSS